MYNTVNAKVAQVSAALMSVAAKRIRTALTNTDRYYGPAMCSLSHTNTSQFRTCASEEEKRACNVRGAKDIARRTCEQAALRSYGLASHYATLRKKALRIRIVREKSNGQNFCSAQVYRRRCARAEDRSCVSWHWYLMFAFQTFGEKLCARMFME